jgi:hypothetical protein
MLKILLKIIKFDCTQITQIGQIYADKILIRENHKNQRHLRAKDPKNKNNDKKDLYRR